MAEKEHNNPEKIKIWKWEFNLPGSKLGRIIVGLLLVLGGFLWFLPVLGFWMLPLGLMILAKDLHLVRRFNRRFSVWWAGRKKK